MRSVPRRVALACAAWIAAISALHLWLNSDAFEAGVSRPREAGGKFRVGFLPVT